MDRKFSALGQRSPRHGSALILVLWCLIILGMAVFGVVEIVQLSVEHTTQTERAVEARALALSGLALGLNPQVLKDDPMLAQHPASGQDFKVTVQSEGSRLNLNYVLLSEHRDILVNLFVSWGLKIDDADRVTDCLYDWVTPGDLRSLNGAKVLDYEKANLPQRPSHAPFLSWQEVGQVLNIDLLTKARPNWQDSFTLWSEGPLNVNEAPAELMAAVFGLQPGRLKIFTEMRDGKDGIPGTADDVPVPDLKTLGSDLGLSDFTLRTLRREVTFGDSLRRITSVGRADGTQVTFLVVARLKANPAEYLVWTEQ